MPIAGYDMNAQGNPSQNLLHVGVIHVHPDGSSFTYAYVLQDQPKRLCLPPVGTTWNPVQSE